MVHMRMGYGNIMHSTALILWHKELSTIYGMREDNSK